MKGGRAVLQEYIYAVARVRARETKLLTRADLERLMACATEDECLQVLADKGWGREGEHSAAQVLAAEEEKTWAFLGELTEDFTPFAPLSLPVDCNNLKAAVKCAYLETEPRDVFLPGGQWKAEQLLAMAQEGDFSPLPALLAQGAQKARQALLHTGDGQLCDALLDRACLEELSRVCEESGLPVLARYGGLTVAGADMQIAWRACRAGKNLEFLRLALAPCPSLDVEELALAATKGQTELLACLEKGPWEEAAKALGQSAAAFEKWRDDAAMALLREEKSDYETAGALFAYAAARRRETDTVRVILSGKRNGLDEGKIRERLRETYV